MVALMITATMLVLAGAVVISLERHRRLTPLAAIVTGLGTLAVVLGAITATAASTLPATADDLERGVSTTDVPAPAADIELPTL